MDNLGQRLKDVRLKAGLTLRELARQAEVSPSFDLADRERQVAALGGHALHVLPAAQRLGRRAVRAARRRESGNGAAGRRRGANGDRIPIQRLAALGVLQPRLGGPSLAPAAPHDGRGGHLGAARGDARARRQLHEDQLRARRHVHRGRRPDHPRRLRVRLRPLRRGRGDRRRGGLPLHRGRVAGLRLLDPARAAQPGHGLFEGIWFVHGRPRTDDAVPHTARIAPHTPSRTTSRTATKAALPAGKAPPAGKPRRPARSSRSTAR